MSATFAYALQMVDGVGRATAHRLLKHFASYDDLIAYPREQVLTRIKGVPGAEAIVGRLFDREGMQRLLDRAAQDLEVIAQKRVAVAAPSDPAWPSGLNDLALTDRPVLFYTYGQRDLFHHPTVAVFARPPLSGEAYELVQALASRLFVAGIPVITGAGHGSDVVMHKLAAATTPPSRTAMILSCGMGRLPGPMRPHASGLVKAGGVVASPFPMTHGPYEHDDKGRALVQSALASTSVFVEAHAGSPEQAALDWSIQAGRAVFMIAPEVDQHPAGVQAIRSEGDFGLVLASTS